jgi:ubiquitin C-terminal hydrolase
MKNFSRYSDVKTSQNGEKTGVRIISKNENLSASQLLYPKTIKKTTLKFNIANSSFVNIIGIKLPFFGIREIIMQNQRLLVGMIVDVYNVLTKMQEFGQLISSSDQTAGKIVVYRTILADGKIGLECSSEQDLSFWQKVRRFFGAKDFLLNTIQAVVKQAIQNVGPGKITADQKEGITTLSEKIKKHNQHRDRSVFYRLFSRQVDTLVIPPDKLVVRSATTPPSSVQGTTSSQPSSSQQPQSLQTREPQPSISTAALAKISQPSQQTAPPTQPSQPPKPLLKQPQIPLSQTQIPTSTSSSALPSSSNTVAPTWPIASKDVNPAKTLECDPAKALGLANPGCHCYFNASIKMLWASAGFRTLLEDAIMKGNSYVAESLQDLFKEVSQVVKSSLFQKTGVVPQNYLKNIKESLRAVVVGIENARVRYKSLRKLPDCSILRQLRVFDHEQDAQELCTALIIAVFLAANPKLSQFPFALVSERIDLEKSTRWYRKESGLTQKADAIPSLKDVYIPSIDFPKPLVEDVMIRVFMPVELQPSSKPFDIQDYFNGYQEVKTVDVVKVVNHENNRKLFFPGVSDNPSPVQVQEVVTKCRAKWGQGQKLQPNENPRVEITRRNPIISDAVQHTPPCLMVNIARQAVFSNDGSMQKGTREVSFPYELTVPVETPDGKKVGEAKYVMKAVIVHEGRNYTSGHYYTFIPDPQSNKRSNGIPERWTRHSDDHPVIEVSGNQLNDAMLNIQKNGYVYIYDRIDPPITKRH